MPDRPPPARLLIVCPSWLGDVVMATPALRLLRSSLPGAFLGGLVRPGLDELLAGTDFFDELHVDRARGVMGPKFVANKLRPRRYDAAALLTNSFSTALVTRLAFIPRRIGYDRDGRGLLLTERLKADRRPDGRWACVPAVEYYLRVARAALVEGATGGLPAFAITPRLELASTEAQEREADRILAAANIAAEQPFALLNPGANDLSKRWPAERFGEVAAWLSHIRGLRVLVNGSPAEREVVDQVVKSALADKPPVAPSVISLTNLGVTIGSLKAVIRRAAVMVTNDTGPRHIAAAFRIPTITLFGPTDPRWTTLPDDGTPRRDLVADPDLTPDQLADDHPERCRIDKITTTQVIQALQTLMPGA